MNRQLFPVTQKIPVKTVHHKCWRWRSLSSTGYTHIQECEEVQAYICSQLQYISKSIADNENFERNL